MERNRRLVSLDMVLSYLQGVTEAAAREPEAYMQIAAFCFGKLRKHLEAFPTVYAVEVVRCKDCSSGDGDLICTNPKCVKSWCGCPVSPEHFCSYGRRKSDG